MCLRQPLHALEGKCLKTATIGFVLLLALYLLNLLISANSLLYLQVISATKYIVKKESTRDRVDLLLSCKNWPLVYAVDMACDVVAHAEARLPLMAEAMWGNRRGCFKKPCPERPPQVQAMILRCIVCNIPLHALIYSTGFSSARASTHTQSTSHPIKCCVGAQLYQEFGAPADSDNRQVCGW